MYLFTYFLPALPTPTALEYKLHKSSDGLLCSLLHSRDRDRGLGRRRHSKTPCGVNDWVTLQKGIIRGCGSIKQGSKLGWENKKRFLAESETWTLTNRGVCQGKGKKRTGEAFLSQREQHCQDPEFNCSLNYLLNTCNVPDCVPGIWDIRSKRERSYTNKYLAYAQLIKLRTFKHKNVGVTEEFNARDDMTRLISQKIKTKHKPQFLP